ncbi:MAG: hypothetical protein ACFFG0_09435 [Candidatus Thorarchaeota archaeon]
MLIINSNNIEIEYEAFGDPASTPIISIIWKSSLVVFCIVREFLAYNRFTIIIYRSREVFPIA